LWTLWTPEGVGARPAAVPVDGAGAGAPSLGTLRGMSIEMNAAELHGLANTLRAAAGVAADIPGHLSRPGAVGRGLQAAVDAFLETHSAAGRAFAGELDWLACAVTDVAESWVRMDAALLGRPGGTTAE